MTAAGAFPTDKTNIQYKARTDARTSVITNAEWFYLPHPGMITLHNFYKTDFHDKGILHNYT